MAWHLGQLLADRTLVIITNKSKDRHPRPRGLGSGLPGGAHKPECRAAPASPRGSAYDRLGGGPREAHPGSPAHGVTDLGTSAPPAAQRTPWGRRHHPACPGRVWTRVRSGVWTRKGIHPQAVVLRAVDLGSEPTGHTWNPPLYREGLSLGMGGAAGEPSARSGVGGGAWVKDGALAPDPLGAESRQWCSSHPGFRQSAASRARPAPGGRPVLFPF